VTNVKPNRCTAVQETPLQLPGVGDILRASESDYEGFHQTLRIAAILCAAPLSKIAQIQDQEGLHPDFDIRCTSGLEDLCVALREMLDITEKGLERLGASDRLRRGLEQGENISRESED
jgi:hypothetical protein